MHCDSSGIGSPLLLTLCDFSLLGDHCSSAPAAAAPEEDGLRAGAARAPQAQRGQEGGHHLHLGVQAQKGKTGMRIMGLIFMLVFLWLDMDSISSFREKNILRLIPILLGLSHHTLFFALFFAQASFRPNLGPAHESGQKEA